MESVVARELGSGVRVRADRVNGAESGFQVFISTLRDLDRVVRWAQPFQELLPHEESL